MPPNPRRQTAADDISLDRRTLTRLKWLMTIIPGIGLFLYETVRHGLLANLLPTSTGNLLAGLLALVLAYFFSDMVLGIVLRLQTQAVERGREVASLNATIRERARLSRELHDGLAQVAACLLVRIDTIAGLIEANRQPEAVSELDRMRAIANDLYADVRESIGDLRTDVTERALDQILEDYVATFEERHGITVDLQIDPTPVALSPLPKLEVIRIVQEALANVRKHAHATEVCISLRRSPSDHCLELSVKDNGRGFDLPVRHSAQGMFGLATMRERAAGLGGTFAIESTPGGGTRVNVSIPLTERWEVSGEALANSAR